MCVGHNQLMEIITGFKRDKFWGPIVAWFQGQLAERMPKAKFSVKYVDEYVKRDYSIDFIGNFKKGEQQCASGIEIYLVVEG